MVSEDFAGAIAKYIGVLRRINKAAFVLYSRSLPAVYVHHIVNTLDVVQQFPHALRVCTAHIAYV